MRRGYHANAGNPNGGGEIFAGGLREPGRGGGVVSQPGAVPENAPEFRLLLGRSGQLCQPRMGCSGKSCGAEGPIPVEERT